jgi:hypothetical protein
MKNLSLFFSLPIQQSEYCPEFQEKTRIKTWKRLNRLPKTKTIHTRKQCYYIINERVVMNPKTFQKLKELLK